MKSKPVNATISISPGIEAAIRSSSPVVALESTVITHGLPAPHNLTLARDMERAVQEHGAMPATIAVMDGTIRVGLAAEDLENLASARNVQKISLRDFASAQVKRASGGTTVAGTCFIARKVGIRVFATGGIGGVHDLDTLDISTDLQALARTPIIVVCAGAKAILDLPATLEYLETMAVPVVGYRTDEFPSFYSRQSGLCVSVRLETPGEIVEFARAHWALGMESAVLVCQPLTPDLEIPRDQIQGFIEQARAEARKQGIHGQALTPFLLARLAELTGGRSLHANISLLIQNAVLGAQIACAFASAS
jgi:pseudouridine-5'-phosphate glycosidase